MPNDKYASDQWSIETINIDDAWNISEGSNIKVAVLDTGIFRSHEDFSGVSIDAGYDFVKNKPSVSTDTVGHGTMVSSIICAKRNNGKGIAGIADKVTLVPYKISDSEEISYANSTKAIMMAADSGCKIINLSYGGNEYSVNENAAVQYAISKGCVVVASSGNDGNSASVYPACYDNVISVGAIKNNMSLAEYSNTNYVDVVAPGSSIPVADTKSTNAYANVSGTSFSAPCVTGILALALSANNRLTVKDIELLFRTTSTDLYEKGYDRYTGWGIINAFELLKNAKKGIVLWLEDGAIYNYSILPVFSSFCEVLLDGKEFSKGSSISSEGKHLLAVYDGTEIRSYEFEIAFEKSRAEYKLEGTGNMGDFTSDVKVTFNNCQAFVNGKPIKSGHIISGPGLYTLDFYGVDGKKYTVYTRVKFTYTTNAKLISDINYLSTGDSYVCLYNKFNHVKWFFDESKREIYVFGSFSGTFFDYYYVLNMDDLSIKSFRNVLDKRFDINTTWVVNGNIYTKSFNSLLKYDLYTIIAKETINNLEIETSISNGNTFENSIKNNTLVASAYNTLLIANFDTNTFYSEKDSGYSYHSVASDDGRYVYFTKKWQEVPSLYCYDTVERRIVYTINNIFEKTWPDIFTVTLYNNSLLIAGKSFNAVDGSYQGEALNYIKYISNDIIITGKGIYDASNNTFNENNSICRGDYATINGQSMGYLSKDSKLYYIDTLNNPLVLMKTAKITKPIDPKACNIENNKIYKGSVKPIFENCTAMLDGENFLLGSEILEPGLHTLVLTTVIGTKNVLNFVVEKPDFPGLKFTLDTTTIKIGDSYKPTLNTFLPNSCFKWSASNNNISIKSNGLIVAEKIGETTLTATSMDGQFKASIVINIDVSSVFSSFKIPNTKMFISNGFIFGITDKTTSSDLISCFGANISIGSLGTGSTITVNGSSYKIIMKGDVNGDGKIDSKDYLMIKRSYLGTYKMTDVQLLAACLENTAKPTARDYLRVKRHFLGSYNIYA